MTSKTIGVLTIGQSPRPDLVEPLLAMLPADYQVRQAGALDDLDAADLPSVAATSYPLSTRLRDGSPVMVEEAFLIPRLQAKLSDLEDEGVSASILLCAGTFENLRGNRPLFKPFALAVACLRSLGLQRIGVIAPIVEQEEPIRHRWLDAGFNPTVWTVDLTQQDEKFYARLQGNIERNKLDAILLDYVGHPKIYVKRLRSFLTIPLVDLGHLTMATLVSSL